MNFTIYTANHTGNAKNCSYPNCVEIHSAEQLKDAIMKDHVCATYKNNYRSKENFISSNVIVMDCDNDHSENPSDWIKEEMLDALMPDIYYAIAPSRHHMLAKGNQSARPRFHVYFPIAIVQDADTYADLKVAIQKRYSFFDVNAVDAARFIYGADVKECIWHEGWVTIDSEFDLSKREDGLILEGSRNNTMSRFAGRVLKRYGNTDKAHEAFLEHANKCNPPLPDEELNSIWFSAVKFYDKKVSSQEGYVPPEKYNMEFPGSLRPDDFSDIGEAKILAREYGNELRYNLSTEYLRYDGVRWNENKEIAVGATEEFLDLQLMDANALVESKRQEALQLGIDPSVLKASGKKAILSLKKE